jgi:hypothetical protein
MTEGSVSIYGLEKSGIFAMFPHMSYSLADVDAAVKYIREKRPETLISRGDYDWSLAVADKAKTKAIILFRCGDELQTEIKSSISEIAQILFWLGPQWTLDQIKALQALANKP